MRGFPLLGTLAVVAFFAAAWWPLRALTEARPANASEYSPPSESDSSSAVSLETLTVRVGSSRPLERLIVEHLGKPVLVIDTPTDGGDIERRLEGIALPPEGVEFWIDATFVPGTGDNADTHRVALSVEILPDDPEREPRQISLWGDPGERAIADLAVFEWPENAIE